MNYFQESMDVNTNRKARGIFYVDCSDQKKDDNPDNKRNVRTQ